MPSAAAGEIRPHLADSIFWCYSVAMEIPAQMKLNYIERRKKEMPLCEESLAKRDYKTIERIGHQLKGNGQAFGFDHLSKLGEAIESAAREEDHARLSGLVSELGTAVRQLSA